MNLLPSRLQSTAAKELFSTIARSTAKARSKYLVRSDDHTSSTPASPDTQQDCRALPPPGHLLISRSGFIAAITICAVLTTVSLLALTWCLWREHVRHRQLHAAHGWGRQSHYGARLSILRKEVDDSYSRRYNGVMVNQYPENPEMGSDSPVELTGQREDRIWEAPAVPPKHPPSRKNVGSLFFDPGAGIWKPKT